MAWSSPRTFTNGETITDTIMNGHLRDQLLHIAGTSGFTGTPSATRGIEPTSGYFMGAAAQNRHVEFGTVTLPLATPSSVAITFANAFASGMVVILTSQDVLPDNTPYCSSVTTTGATANSSAQDPALTLGWIAGGVD